MGKKILVLHLEGLLQSYGIQAPWEFRLSDFIPTKSAIIGLLGCALGIPRNDERLMDLDNKLKMAVRVDRQGEMFSDFQVISGFLYNANGKKLKEAGKDTVTKLSNRQYLQDSSFLVGLEGEEDILIECYNALHDPVWPLYLGRKCCVPSTPIVCKDSLTESYSCLETLMKEYPLSERHDNAASIMYQIEDIKGTNVKYDSTQSKVGDRYYPRYVKNVYINK